MATGGSETMSDEIVNIKCSICAEKDRTREADNYCVECKDYFCSSNIDVHSIIPALRRHKLLDRADFRSLGPEGSLPSVPTQRCTIHQTEVINMYCRDHDDVACALCIVLDHRSCTILSITDDIESLYKNIDLKDVKLKLNNSKKCMEKIKTNGEANLEMLNESFDRAIVSIQELRQNIETILDKLEQETLMELKKECGRKEQIFREAIENAADAISSIDSIASNLKKSEGNKAEEYVCIKSCSKVIANGEDLLKREQQTPTEAVVKFEVDTKITDFLIKMKTFRHDSDLTQGYKQFSTPTSFFKINNQREINVRLENDSVDCRIFDSCIASDDCLLLTDYENKKLKRFDMSKETVTDYLSLPAAPVGVCKISNLEVAVTLSNKSVQLISLGDRLTLTRNFRTNHYCSGIAYSNGQLFISNEKATVHIHNMKGYEVKKVTGSDKFQESRGIAVNESGDRVFVADADKGLIILDSDRSHLCTLSGPMMSKIQGVCTDGRNVFVCGHTTENIAVIGHSYQLLDELGYVFLPLSIEFDKKRSRMIVTHDDNNITLIDIGQGN